MGWLAAILLVLLIVFSVLAFMKLVTWVVVGIIILVAVALILAMLARGGWRW